MGISHYLAMTAAETEAFPLPESYALAYMACHFSPYSTGLSNIPTSLPSGSMLIVNDRTPICGHDPQKIAEQLLQAMEQLHFHCVLLDFQRPGSHETAALCPVLIEALPCPVGISDIYAAALDCPVFLPPAPLDQPLAEYIAPWEGREIWLDIAPDAACVTVTEKGSGIIPCSYSPPPENAFPDESLHCLYRAEVLESEIKFRLWRDSAQITALMDEAQALGITKCIGLYQQFCADK